MKTNKNINLAILEVTRGASLAREYTLCLWEQSHSNFLMFDYQNGGF